MKKMTAVILVLALSLGLVLPASADPAEQTPKTYEKAFFMGDSNCMGYGLEGYMNYETNDFVFGLEGSFPKLTANGLQASCVNMSYPAFRAKDALIYLGGEPYAFSERDQAHQDHYITAQLPNAEAAKLGGVGGYTEELKDADLVVIELGSADILFCTLTMAWAYGGDDIAALVSILLEEMYTNYQEYQQEFPLLLQHIRKLNENCEIVLVGTWNPAKDLTYNDEVTIPLLEGIAAVSMWMNRDYQSWAKEYGAVYVDVSNVETCTSAKGVTIESLIDGTDIFNDVFHASPEGYQYIARQILNALADKPVTTDIRIDLGSAQSVSAVTLDNRIVTDYSFDPETSTLTIPNLSLLQSVVTVTYQGTDGGTCFAAYQLSWKMDSGYVAYRLYCTKNVVATLTSTSNLLKKSLSAMVSKIKDLFQKS